MSSYEAQGIAIIHQGLTLILTLFDNIPAIRFTAKFVIDAPADNVNRVKMNIVNTMCNGEQ